MNYCGCRYTNQVTEFSIPWEATL